MHADNSINYNYGATIALNNLNSTATDLSRSYNAVSTGKRVGGAVDNPAVWAVAQRTTADASALDAVVQSLQRNLSVNSTAVSAGQQIVDLLSQIKNVVAAAADPSTDANSRTNQQAQLKNLIAEINNTAKAATFNGINLIKSGATSIFAMGSADGATKITLTAQVLAIKQGGVYANGITFSAGVSFTTATQASNLLSLVNNSITNVTGLVAVLGNNDSLLNNQLTFVQSLQQQLQGGVSNLVDADMAKESAKLQALQAKQQLGVQALSIANSSKSSLLSLFR
jgi:flagellin